ncbi:PAS domain-containing protein [Natrinema ejinorense]|uniref:Histidine kinase n=1 Tax=Natrinema ejinorense TaxID=373386 RepID=A0A2A5QWH7_9EURY|nr:PAS domain-containing protein [Natrinema ejinorense]PCR91175.1 histidine kinase [Natrinema ejinorense]
MTVENEGGDRQRDRRHHEAVLELMREETVVDGDFDDAVRSITETAVRTVDCTRASIWLFDGDHVRCVDRYDGRTDEHAAGTELTAADYPAYFEALRTHRSISAVDARSDPRTRELTAAYLEPAGIDSLLDATVRADGDVIGMVCHEQVGRTREWSDAEIRFAGDVADVVHRALRNHRRAERRRELELKNRAIDEAPIGITLSAPDDDNPLIYANEQFEQLTGYAREDAFGRNCRFLQGPRTEPEPLAEMRAAIDAERPCTVELRNYRKDGSEFWNRVTIAPVANDDGDVMNYVGFQQDVTDRKEATRQLRVLHRVLRHNLSNQLNIVRGTAEQLLEGATDAETAAETIIEETDHLLGITDKHRSIVRLLSDRPSPGPIEIESLCRRVIRTVATEYPDAEITLEGESAVTVSAIPALETAIRELVENGLAHGERSQPVVVLRVDRRPETVRIRITDDGPGLPAEEARILTGDQAVEPLYHGLGMGLWLVYWIATLSRGTITVEETGSNGTTICLEVPRADASG